MLLERLQSLSRVFAKRSRLPETVSFPLLSSFFWDCFILILLLSCLHLFSLLPLSTSSLKKMTSKMFTIPEGFHF